MKAAGALIGLRRELPTRDNMRAIYRCVESIALPGPFEEGCAKEDHRSARKTGNIGQNIQLYGLAYRIAWEQISPVRKREQPDIALRLHASIRRQLQKGATDPLFIATEAFKALNKETEPGTR
jgi:hypothetical protein